MGEITLERADLSTQASTLALVGHRAFRQSGSPDGWELYFRDNTAVLGGETVVASRDGITVGHATTLGLTMGIAGAEIAVGGVAGVSVLPEARKSGVADGMMRTLVDWMRARRVPLSMLYAFRLRYYAKYGYATQTGGEQMRAAPSQFPTSPLRAHVRPAVPTDAMPALQEVFSRWREGRTGPLLRDDWWWKTRVLGFGQDVATYTDPDSGKIEGYVIYKIPRDPDYPRQSCEVWDMAAYTPRAWAGLFGFLHALGDQYARIIVDLPRGMPALLLREHGLVDSPDDWLYRDPIAFVSSGPMARLIDLPAAFAAHPTAARRNVQGRLGLTVSDPLREAPTEHTVSFQGTAGTVVADGLQGGLHLALSVVAVSLKKKGTTTATTLCELGHAEGSAEAAALLDAALQGPTLYQGPADAF